MIKAFVTINTDGLCSALSTLSFVCFRCHHHGGTMFTANPSTPQPDCMVTTVTKPMSHFATLAINSTQPMPNSPSLQTTLLQSSPANSLPAAIAQEKLLRKSQGKLAYKYTGDAITSNAPIPLTLTRFLADDGPPFSANTNASVQSSMGLLGGRTLGGENVALVASNNSQAASQNAQSASVSGSSVVTSLPGSGMVSAEMARQKVRTAIDSILNAKFI